MDALEEEVYADGMYILAEGDFSPGRESHSDTALYISLVILYRKFTGRRQNDFNVYAVYVGDAGDAMNIMYYTSTLAVPAVQRVAVVRLLTRL